jgi:lipoate-protein ligase A
MSSPVCRLLPIGADDGPHNMAADEVLLESAVAGLASLRFYGWSEPTLSLGYFQPERLRRADPCLAALPYVRRPSGGAALVHHYEVTYCLALPAGGPWQTGEPWLRRMHALLAAALRSLGVGAAMHGPEREQPFTGVLCFQHLTVGDLLIGPAKVVGSAQRRQRGALIQHGGILLAASPYAPALPGIRELSGKSLTPEETCAGVVGEFAVQTGWELAEAAWSDGERRRMAELVQTKYTQDDWNRKR